MHHSCETPTNSYSVSAQLPNLHSSHLSTSKSSETSNGAFDNKRPLSSPLTESMLTEMGFNRSCNKSLDQCDIDIISRSQSLRDPGDRGCHDNKQAMAEQTVELKGTSENKRNENQYKFNESTVSKADDDSVFYENHQLNEIENELSISNACNQDCATSRQGNAQTEDNIYLSKEINQKEDSIKQNKDCSLNQSSHSSVKRSISPYITHRTSHYDHHNNSSTLGLTSRSSIQSIRSQLSKAIGNNRSIITSHRTSGNSNNSDFCKDSASQNEDVNDSSPMRKEMKIRSKRELTNPDSNRRHSSQVAQTSKGISSNCRGRITKEQRRRRNSSLSFELPRDSEYLLNCRRRLSIDIVDKQDKDKDIECAILPDALDRPEPHGENQHALHTEHDISKRNTDITENDVSNRKTNNNENDISNRSNNNNENDIGNRNSFISENDISNRSNNITENDISNRSTYITENDISNRNTNVPENETGSRSTHDVPFSNRRLPDSQSMPELRQLPQVCNDFINNILHHQLEHEDLDSNLMRVPSQRAHLRPLTNPPPYYVSSSQRLRSSRRRRRRLESRRLRRQYRLEEIQRIRAERASYMEEANERENHSLGPTDYCYTGLVLLVLSSAYLALGLSIASLGPLLSDMSKRLQFSPTKVILLTFYRTFGFALSIFITTKRFFLLNHKTMVFLSLVTLGVTQTILSFMKNYLGFIVFIALNGLCQGGVYASVTIACYLNARRYIKSCMFVVHLMYGIGTVIAPVIIYPSISGPIPDDIASVENVTDVNITSTANTSVATIPTETASTEDYYYDAIGTTLIKESTSQLSDILTNVLNPLTGDLNGTHGPSEMVINVAAILDYCEYFPSSFPAAVACQLNDQQKGKTREVMFIIMGVTLGCAAVVYVIFNVIHPQKQEDKLIYLRLIFRPNYVVQEKFLLFCVGVAYYCVNGLELMYPNLQFVYLVRSLGDKTNPEHLIFAIVIYYSCYTIGKLFGGTLLLLSSNTKGHHIYILTLTSMILVAATTLERFVTKDEFFLQYLCSGIFGLCLGNISTLFMLWYSAYEKPRHKHAFSLFFMTGIGHWAFSLSGALMLSIPEPIGRDLYDYSKIGSCVTILVLSVFAFFTTFSRRPLPNEDTSGEFSVQCIMIGFTPLFIHAFGLNYTRCDANSSDSDQSDEEEN